MGGGSDLVYIASIIATIAVMLPFPTRSAHLAGERRALKSEYDLIAHQMEATKYGSAKKAMTTCADGMCPWCAVAPIVSDEELTPRRHGIMSNEPMPRWRRWRSTPDVGRDSLPVTTASRITPTMMHKVAAKRTIAAVGPAARSIPIQTTAESRRALHPSAARGSQPAAKPQVASNAITISIGESEGRPCCPRIELTRESP